MAEFNYSIDYYKLLGVEYGCDFKAIKQAYYSRAKQCHPDLHGNSPQKTEEFKQVVMAFDVLSDPEKRARYDLRFKSEEEKASSETVIAYQGIMDTEADDVLEELIVGNACPENTTLTTLFLDLQKTEVFITFREGKTLFHQKRFREAKSYLMNAVTHSPYNIIYRVFLARDLAVLKEYKMAKFHFRSAIDIGRKREPVQYLRQVKRELDMVKKAYHPFWSAFMGLFKSDDDFVIKDSDQEMIERTNRELTRLARKNNISTKKRKLLK
jgi:curved DNA-binding protein CbpA